ncbi:hypothetical protein RJ639_031191, partial [Escallonia herrerae]
MKGQILRIRLVLLAWLHLRSPPVRVSFLRSFSYKDIKRATDGFRRIVDNSSHGTAYKAKLQNGNWGLVKEVDASDDQDDAFYRELQLLGRLHHRHIVALRGFSIGHKRFLVFENIENGSLKEHLNDPLKSPLNWRTRLQIAIDVAAALVSLEIACFLMSKIFPKKHFMGPSQVILIWVILGTFRSPSGSVPWTYVSCKSVGSNSAPLSNLNWPTDEQGLYAVTSDESAYFQIIIMQEYLHFFCEPPVYHVSINSSTIMLDENFTAKLSDVGLLSSGGNFVTSPHISCSKECMGQACGNIIFQLGLLILELITGQSSAEGGADLIKWVQKSCFRRSIHNMIDPDLGNNYDSQELRGLLAVARLFLKSVDKPTHFAPQIFRYLQKKSGESAFPFTCYILAIV